MRIVILGGTGFIGSRVAALLAGRDHDVRLVHRNDSRGAASVAVRHLLTPFSDLGDRLGELRADPLDVVLDMVPYIDKGGHGVLHFRGLAERAVVITSCDVYRAFARLWGSEPGPPDSVPLTEDSPLREARAPDIQDGDGVDFDNVEVERAVAGCLDLPVTVLRLPATHGPGDPQRRLAGYVKRMADGRPVVIVDERRASWRWARGYVENVAAAIALAVEDDRAAGRIYNVAAPIAYTEEEWIRRIGAWMNWQGSVVALPAETLPQHLRGSHDFRQDLAVDSSRIRSELGYAEIVEENEGLGITVAWQRENLSDTPAADYAAEDEAVVSGS